MPTAAEKKASAPLWTGFCPLAPRLYSQASSSVLACQRAMGRRIPEEISVLGLSGRLEASEKKEPFTVVRQDSLSLGRAAFYMLEGLRNKIPMGRLLLRPQLILRDTTGPCARHL